MKSLKNNAIDIISLSLVGILFLFFIIPWPFPQINVKYSQEPFTKQIDFTNKTETKTSRTVAQCAALFGVRLPKASSDKSASSLKSPDNSPQKADWIKYIGLIATPQGEKKYYFKDTRSNRIIKLALGETADGWTLSGSSAAQFTLKNAGKIYLVEK